VFSSDSLGYIVLDSPTDTLRFQVRFNPAVDSSFKNSLIIIYSFGKDSANYKDTVVVSGTGNLPLPNLFLVDTAGFFGGVLINDTRDVAMVTVKNSGGIAAQATGVTPSNAAFSIVSPSFPQTIKPDSAKTFIVRFALLSEVTVTGTLTFSTTDAAHPNLVFNVSGTGMLPNAGTLSYVEYVKDDSAGVNGLNSPRSLAVSPDGAHEYAAGFSENAMAVFSRNPVSGSLAFIEYHKDDSAGVSGLNSPSSIPPPEDPLVMKESIDYVLLHTDIGEVSGVYSLEPELLFDNTTVFEK